MFTYSQIRERFFGYFRLSDRRRQDSTSDRPGSFEEESSIMLENGGPTINLPRIVSTMESTDSKYKELDSKKSKPSIKRPLENRQHNKVRTISVDNNGRRIRGETADNYLDNTLSLDAINNSCSNITASTYCINGGERDSIQLESSPLPQYSEAKQSSLSVFGTDQNCNSQRSSFRKKLPQIPIQHLMDKRPSYASTDVSSRRESTTTLDRDFEIIDMLERERSMDLQEIMENDKSFPQPFIPRGSRKMPRTPMQISNDETDGYAGDRSTCSGHSASTINSARRAISERMPYERPIPMIRRTSHDIDDILPVVDRKLYRTKSTEPKKGAASEVRKHLADQYRRHSSEKYPFVNNKYYQEN